jgi:hypothetical protein
MKVSSALAFLGLPILALGCNLIMDLGRFSEAVSTDGGGERPGDGGVVDDGGPFGCLLLPPETLDPSAVTVQVLVTNSTAPSETAGSIDGGSDLIDVVYTPYPGMAVVPCNILDPTCSMPLANSQVTDGGGVVTFSLTGTFNGLFYFTSPSTVPSLFFPGPLLAEDKSVQLFTAALTSEAEQALNSAINNAVILDASAGLGEVFLSVYDCNDHRLAGVTFSFNNPGTQQLPFYLISGIPNTATELTDYDGVGGAVNVPSGSQKITATYVATSTTLGTTDVYVQGGALTIGYIRTRALHQQP